jgi:hypothetical protein
MKKKEFLKGEERINEFYFFFLVFGFVFVSGFLFVDFFFFAI